MKTLFTLFILSFFTLFAANTFAKDPDLNGCWDVYIDQISSWGTPVDGQPGERISLSTTQLGFSKVPMTIDFRALYPICLRAGRGKFFGYRDKKRCLYHSLG